LYGEQRPDLRRAESLADIFEETARGYSRLSQDPGVRQQVSSQLGVGECVWEATFLAESLSRTNILSIRNPIMDLIQTITSQLGLSQPQAQGAIGGIFNLLKSKLAPEEITRMKGAIPGLEQFSAAAPAAGGLMGAFGSMMGGNAGLAAQALTVFQKLGIKTDQIGPIVKLVTEHLGANGCEDIVKKISALVGR
jgi:hypothetical protein